VVASRTRAIPVAFQAKRGRLEIGSEGVDRRALRRIAARIFSLDIDLDHGASFFSEDPNLMRALRRGGGRMLRAPTAFEDAVKVLFTTSCSWEATRGMVTRLISLAGADGRAFPSPSAVASLSPARLKSQVLCGYRAESLSRFARRVESGKLDLSRWEDPG